MGTRMRMQENRKPSCFRGGVVVKTSEIFTSKIDIAVFNQDVISRQGRHDAECETLSQVIGCGCIDCRGLCAKDTRLGIKTCRSSEVSRCLCAEQIARVMEITEISFQDNFCRYKNYPTCYRKLGMHINIVISKHKNLSFHNQALLFIHLIISNSSICHHREPS